MPTASEYGRGFLSVNMPICGCSSDAVSMKASVSIPTWLKSRCNWALSIG